MTHRRNYEREEATGNDRYCNRRENARNRTVKGTTGDYRSDDYKTSEDNPEEEKYCDCSCHRGRTGGRKSSGRKTNKGRTGGRKSSGRKTNKGRTGGRKSSGGKTNKGRTGGRKSSSFRTGKGRSHRKCSCWCCRCRSDRK